MPITRGWLVRAASVSGDGIGASAAWCGWTPTVHQTFGAVSASAGKPRD